MSKAMGLARQGLKALKQCNLLRASQSEIQYELSSNPFQERGSSSLGDFVVEWDSPRSQDVVLKRKSESDKEVAVSALLGPFHSEENSVEKYIEYPREALMKVYVKKPGLSSMLQSDCSVFERLSVLGPYSTSIMPIFFNHQLVLALLSTEALHSDGDLSACIKTKSLSTQTVREKLVTNLALSPPSSKDSGLCQDELLQYPTMLVPMAVDAMLSVMDPVKLDLVNSRPEDGLNVG